MNPTEVSNVAMTVFIDMIHRDKPKIPLFSSLLLQVLPSVDFPMLGF